MRKLSTAVVAAAGLSLIVLSPLQAGTLVPLPQLPGSVDTTLEGINDSNEIAGFYETSDFVDHGFVGDLNGNYTTFDIGTANTVVHGLNNDGFVTGTSANEEGYTVGPVFLRHPNGSVDTVTKDGSPIDGYADGITNHQKFVGSIYVIDDQGLEEYGYYGKGATYRADLVLPFNTSRTRPRGLNKYGEVAGYYHDNDDSDRFYRGFVLKDGVATTVDYPDLDAYWQWLYGINNKGTIVGTWEDVNDTEARGYVIDFERMRFKKIDVPGATFVNAYGINNAGVVAMSIDGAPYIYCSKRNVTCPAGGRRAIEIADRWVSAPQNFHALVCRHGCLAPWNHGAGVGRDAAPLAKLGLDRGFRHDLH